MREAAAGPRVVAAPAADAPHEPAAGSAWRGVLRRLAADPLAALGLAIIVAFALAALLAPALAPHDPTAVDPFARLQGPSLRHPLGTDNLGRDMLSRLLHGARWSLGLVALATLMVMTIGVTLGALAGYVGGLLDGLLMRVVDLLLAFPGLILALAIAGTLGPGIGSVMIGLVAVWWAPYGRIVRGMVLGLRERPFVEAAQALGFRRGRIVFRHLVPNTLPSVIVLMTLEMGELILVAAALSFLGLGAQPPTPEWGAMLAEARPFLTSAPQLMMYPGLAIGLVVLGFNLLGDGLRDALDPRLYPRGSGV